MAKYVEQLSEHERLRKRWQISQKKSHDVCGQLETEDRRTLLRDGKIAAYLAGSLGRGEAGELSDLDLFLLTTRPDRDRSHLSDVEILACVIDVNRILEYGPFSNDGQYLKIYPLDQMLRALGAPQDDSENLFTARMLLLLESRCVFNHETYNDAVQKILEHYFRDSRGKTTFRPLFLLNDILRYWRTLCLNYELIRDDPGKPWRKKNINLKFSRMLTVFGTVLPLITDGESDVVRVRELMNLSPHQRFAKGLDALGDPCLEDGYARFLDDYESFLRWKENMGGEQELSDEDLDRESRSASHRYAEFVYCALTHEKIDPVYRRFLVL